MIKKRLRDFISYLDIGQAKFERECGLANGYVNNIRQSITPDKLQKIALRYPELNKGWLMTGEGEMLKKVPDKDHLTAVKAPHSLPLVSTDAVAGFGNNNFVISEADVKEYYVIPKFRFCKVDFMIEISGSSMYPKYNSGDIVACTILHERKFIQWNKCHIIATREQGILCKRLRPSQVEGCITAVSDNENYPPFDIPFADITGIALVVGVIRLE